jgi:hypothetical protein
MNKTPTPVPKKTATAAGPAQKKLANIEKKKELPKKDTP